MKSAEIGNAHVVFAMLAFPKISPGISELGKMVKELTDPNKRQVKMNLTLPNLKERSDNNADTEV